MITTQETCQSIVDTTLDAFGSVAMTDFAKNPNGSHLFRAQHEQIRRLLSAALDLSPKSSISASDALLARQIVTKLTACMSVHQSLEVPLMRRALERDARMRMALDQMEREMGPVISDLMAISRAFATPSQIFASALEFSQSVRALEERVTDRFRIEERELFSVYDRAMAVASTATTQAHGVEGE
jgi:hypothetical protein